MSKQSLGKVLVVEDESAMRELLAEQLTKRGFEVKVSEGAEQALRLVGDQDFSAVLTDLNLKGMNGIELCRRAVQNRPDIPVLVITAFGSLESAIQAIRAGAWDFITKPVEMESLAIAVERAVKHHALREEVKRLRHQADAIAPAYELLGDSEAVRKVQQLIGRVSDSDASVLITGETGTGKEVVARALHRRSPPQGGRLRGGQLRRDARDPARERAVRPREGRLHRRQGRPGGPVQAGRRRHPVARRGGRAAARAAAQAAARAAGAQGAPGGRQHRGHLRRPHHRRHQRRPRRARSKRAASATTSSTGST